MRALVGAKNMSGVGLVGCRLLQFLVVIIAFSLVGVRGTSNQNDCFDLFETYDQGVYVCHDHPDLIPALHIAESMGRVQCQRAFEGERWNCSGFSILKSPNITSRVTREAAYVHALSLAAIAHSVTKVCATGDNTTCSCEGEKLDLPQRDAAEFHCSDIVGFGITFAMQFLLKRNSTTTTAAGNEVLFHNLMIAARVVREKTVGAVTPCKCLGISGSCTLLSCSNELPHFSATAKKLLHLYYDHSCLMSTDTDYSVLGSNTSLLTTVDTQCTQTSHDYLLYLDDYPNYCAVNEAMGSLGTVGRECNPQTNSSNSCNNLCTQCGREYTKLMYTYKESCHCRFQYCCDIHCQLCARTDYIFVCS